MISESHAKRYCREDITLIENYSEAMNDKSQTWECHHRDEVKTLPSGIVVIRSKQDLLTNGRYYNCPANELIFLTKAEHSRLHSLHKNEDRKRKYYDDMSKFAGYGMKNKKHKDESKKKTSNHHKKVRELFLKNNLGLSWNEFQKYYKMNGGM